MGLAPALLARMNDLLTQMDACFGKDESYDIVRYSDLNTHFHAALALAATSAVIEGEIARVTQLPFASPSAFLPDRSRLAAFRRTLVVGQSEHRAIVEAMAAREGARAEALVREHARAARRNVEYLFARGFGADGALGLLAG